MKNTRFRSVETGDTISASGIVHGARYGLEIEGTGEEGAILIDGERYERIEEDD